MLQKMTDTQQQTATESDALPSIPPTQPAEPKLEPTHQESPALGGSPVGKQQTVGKQSAVELPNQCTAAAVAPAPVAPAAAQQANQPTAALAQPPSAVVQQAQQAAQQSPAAAAGAAALPVHSQQPSKQGGTITPAAANGGQVKAPGPLPVRPYLETTGNSELTYLGEGYQCLCVASWPRLDRLG